SLKQNMGKGFAVKTGVSYSDGDYILFTDADGSTPIEELDEFKVFLNNSYSGILIGKRKIKEEAGNRLILITRRLARYTYKRIRMLLFLKNIEDTQCGFKIFSSDLKDYFIALQRQYRYSFDIELLSITKLLKKDIKEVSINWIYKPGSKINIVKDSLKMFYELFKIKIAFISGSYRLDKVDSLKKIELAKIKSIIVD
ncbi:MAG: glycosyltransferase, partial [bacterium]